MDFPLTLHFFGRSLSLHFIFETLAFVIGFRYFLYLKRNKQSEISSSNYIWILIGASFGALICSRLLGALERPDIFFSDQMNLFYLYTNKTIVGGLLGGLFGVELTKKLIGEKESSGDLMTYPLILAIMIGRIGCFSMGIHEETYGIATNLPWGMNLGDGLLRHPVALYEIFFLLFLWLSLKKIKNRIELQNGVLFKLFMIGYLLFRFILEFIKPSYINSFNLSTIQVACLLGLIYYFCTIYNLLFDITTLRKQNG